MPPSKGGQKLKKNKSPKITKVGSQTFKKYPICCSIVIGVQRCFVELEVALL
jgi:hypothetical protein